jgi:hypothetical protein
MRSQEVFNQRSELRLEIPFDGRFASEEVLIFFSLGRRFFLDIDVS